MKRYFLLAAIALMIAAQFMGPTTHAMAQTLSLDAKKDLSRRSLAMWESSNTDDPDAVFTPDYVNHQEPVAEGTSGNLTLDDWKSVVAQNHTAFPDLALTILLQVAEGDLVATHWKFSGTQTGAYLGQEPTGKQATWTGVQIDLFAGDKIVESWVTWDKYTLFHDLGLLK